MAITLLTFDLDDTLWPCMQTIMRTEASLYQWFHQYHPYISQQYSIQQLYDKRQQLKQSHPHIAHDFTALRKKSWLDLAIEMNYPPEKEQQFIQEALNLYTQERNQVDLYEDVIPTLKSLKKNYQIGAVSNGNADIIRIGLGHLFDFSWSACDAGQQKPHPIVFHSLMKKYQKQADEIIHIGDDPENDIKGAQQLGIRAIWLNRNKSTWPKSLNSPFIEINQLNQLPAILSRL